MPPVPDAQACTPKDQITAGLESHGETVIDVDYTDAEMRADNFLRDISEDTVVGKSNGQADMVCYYQYATTSKGYLDTKHLYQHVAWERPVNCTAKDQLDWQQVKPAATFVKDTIAHYKKVDAATLKPDSVNEVEEGMQLQISAGGQAMTVTIGQNTLRIGGKSFPMPDRNILYQNPIEIRAFIKDAVINYQEADSARVSEEDDTATLKSAYPELVLQNHWYKGEKVQHRQANLTAVSVKGFDHYSHEVKETSIKNPPTERQDASAVFNGENTAGVCVADGHGSPNCPFSADGAQAATEVFKEIGRQFDTGEWTRQTPNVSQLVRQHIITSWQRRITEIHYREGRKNFNVQQYGTTLAGAFRLPNGDLLVLNIGDGSIYATQDQAAPHPKLLRLASDDAIGNDTRSLSALRPNDITVSIYDAATSGQWDMIHLVTDGLYNSFESDQGFYKLFVDIHEDREMISDIPTMAEWMAYSSAQGGGDDVSYASLELK